MLLIANWYRPGASIHDGFERLYSDVAKYYHEVSGVFIAGDLNIHHIKWLRFSNENSSIGQQLQDFCHYYGLAELIRGPTRDNIC